MTTNEILNPAYRPWHQGFSAFLGLEDPFKKVSLGVFLMKTCF